MTSTDITAIIAAVETRAHGYLGEYKAMSENTLGEQALAETLAKSEYMEYVRKAISGQQIGYYRKAWALASHFPEVAARVGQNGEIHKAIGYAIGEGMSSAKVNNWIKSTVEAILASDDQARDLSAAIKALREKAKAEKIARETVTPDPDEEEGTPEAPETPETHPQEIADGILVNLLSLAGQYAAAIEAGADVNVPSLQQIARTLAPFINARKVA